MIRIAKQKNRIIGITCISHPPFGSCRLLYEGGAKKTPFYSIRFGIGVYALSRCAEKEGRPIKMIRRPSRNETVRVY